MTGAIEGEIDEDAAGVGDRMVHATHPRPAPGHLEEAFLDEALGRREVPHHEVAGAQELVGTSGDEPFELLLGPVLAPVSHHARSNRPEVSIISLNPRAVRKVASRERIGEFGGPSLGERGHALGEVGSLHHAAQPHPGVVD